MTEEQRREFEDIEAKLYNLLYGSSLHELIVPQVHDIASRILKGSLTYEEAERVWLELTSIHHDKPVFMLVRLWHTELLPKTIETE